MNGHSNYRSPKKCQSRTSMERVEKTVKYERFSNRYPRLYTFNAPSPSTSDGKPGLPRAGLCHCLACAAPELKHAEKIVATGLRDRCSSNRWSETERTS